MRYIKLSLRVLQYQFEERLDEQSLLACRAYADLNPIRATMAPSLLRRRRLTTDDLQRPAELPSSASTAFQTCRAILRFLLAHLDIFSACDEHERIETKPDGRTCRQAERCGRITKAKPFPGR